MFTSCPFVLCRYWHSHVHCSSWPLQASALTCPPPFSAFYCHLHFYAHCSPLVFLGACIHIPSASLWPLQALTLTYQISLSLMPTSGTYVHLLILPSGLCRQLHSCIHCPLLDSASIRTHLPTVPLWPLQAPTLTWLMLTWHLKAPAFTCPLFACPLNLQSHAPVPSGLYRHLHSKAHCPHLPSANTCTDMTIVCLASAGTCTHIPTANQTGNPLTDNSLW